MTTSSSLPASWHDPLSQASTTRLNASPHRIVGLRSIIVHRGYPWNAGPAHGIQRYVSTLARSMTAAGNPMAVLTSGPGGSIVDHGVAVHTVETRPPAIRGWWRLDRLVPADHLWISRAFARALRGGLTRNADIVQFGEFLGEGLWFARGPRAIPVVVRTHHPRWRAAIFDGEPRTPRLWLIHQLEMGSLRAADAVTAASRAFLAEVSGSVNVRRKLTAVIPNPLDLEMFRPPATGASADYLLFPARLERRKGADLLPALIGELRRRGVQLPVLVAGGPGRDSGFAERIHRELLALPGVKLLGAVGQAELVSLYQGALAALLPTRDENFSNSCVESLACGTPPITSRVGGTPEIVTDGVDGILTDAGDVRAVVEAVCGLAANRQRRDEMGRRARQRAEGLVAPAVVAEKTAAFYAEVIDQYGGRRARPARR